MAILICQSANFLMLLLILIHSFRRDIDISSTLSSPLTSLSSLDDNDSVPPSSMEPAVYLMDDVNFAQVRRHARETST